MSDETVAQRSDKVINKKVITFIIKGIVWFLGSFIIFPIYSESGKHLEICYASTYSLKVYYTDATSCNYSEKKKSLLRSWRFNYFLNVFTSAYKSVLL